MEIADPEFEQAIADEWREEALRTERLCQIVAATGRGCPSPTKEKAEAAWSQRTDNSGPADEPRDDQGRWTSAGDALTQLDHDEAMTGSPREKVSKSIAYVSDTKGKASLADHVVLAERLVADLRELDRESLHDEMKAGGVEGIRPGDSKTALLQRLRSRVTASLRARERSEV